MYDIAGKWLAGQGLIPDNFTNEDVKCYYWHNTSHYLGMDVHDVGPRDKEFEAGNCLAASYDGASVDLLRGSVDLRKRSWPLEELFEDLIRIR